MNDAPHDWTDWSLVDIAPPPPPNFDALDAWMDETFFAPIEEDDED